MPTPREGESRQDFVSRCIPIVLKEDDGLTQEQAAGKCYGIYDSHNKGIDPMHAVRRVNLEPIKAFKTEDGKTKYRAMAIRFGSPEETDWYGTYFDKDTEYHLDWFKNHPWIYDHGMNPLMGPVRIGEWDEIEWTDEGIFFVGELLDHFKYQDAVQELIGQRALYPSTGTLDYLMDWDWKTGHIRSWPIVELSSTTRPAEYRMEAVSPEVKKAVQALRGGIVEMSEQNKTWLQQQLSRLKGQEQEQEPEVLSDELETEAEPVEGEELEQEQELEQEEAVMSIDELAQQLGLKEVVEALKAVDAAIQQIDARLSELQESHNRLAADKVEQVKNSMQNPDWFSQLYVNSKQGEPASKEDLQDILVEQVRPQNVDGGKGSLLDPIMNQ